MIPMALVPAASPPAPGLERYAVAGVLLQVLLCLVLAFNGFAALLVAARGWLYKVPVYRPMLWNIVLSMAQLGIFLAGIVGFLTLVAFADGLPESARPLVQPVVWLAGLALLGIWTLVFPNSGYLITELNLNHRSDRDPVPFWYDIIATLTLSLSGLVNALAGLAFTQTVVTAFLVPPGEEGRPFPPWQSWAFVVLVVLASNFGIYLGRYLRFNSWDIRHPAYMARKFANHVRVRRNRADMVGLTLVYSGTMLLLYPMFYLPLHVVFWQNSFLR